MPGSSPQAGNQFDLGTLESSWSSMGLVPVHFAAPQWACFPCDSARHDPGQIRIRPAAPTSTALRCRHIEPPRNPSLQRSLATPRQSVWTSSRIFLARSVKRLIPSQSGIPKILGIKSPSSLNHRGSTPPRKYPCPRSKPTASPTESTGMVQPDLNHTGRAGEDFLLQLVNAAFEIASQLGHSYP